MLSVEDIEEALRTERSPYGLEVVVLSAALYAENPAWAQEVCLRLSQHTDPTVRRNAVLGISHIARLHGVLDRDLVVPVIESALQDAEPLVRGQADDVASDLEVFLGWRIDRPTVH